ncbi:ornithine carbamoyltransferase [candidate division KSB1 bacterium]|nr:MAG: ornithine carbamoyltransferase [candidate division KSB1 bacterium]
MEKRDFISIADYSREWIEEIFRLTDEIKKKTISGEGYCPLIGKTLAMVFQKPSARTRISFEVGMYQLGGHALYLSPGDIQMGKRESTADIARVLSRYNDGIMARLFAHKEIIELAENATIPVINGLTDLLHPCQVMTDLFTIYEHKKYVDNLKIVFIGDGNNVANSWINMSTKFPFELIVCCPVGYEPDSSIMEFAKKKGFNNFRIMHEPFEAAKKADVLYTDVWVSMGQEKDADEKKKAFDGFRIDSKLLSEAKDDCLVMHCLPAHREEEITDEVIDGPNSVVFDEAENRLHVQKAILVDLIK